MARAVDGWIVADGESWFLATSDLVYTCEATVVSGETDASEADGESDDDWNEWERPGQSQDRSDRSDEQVAVNGGRSVAEDREDENAE
jgi:hypothetical protein